jgi:F-type H+-transporting ATPase subunit b
VDQFAVVGDVARELVTLAVEEGEAQPAGLAINFFWIIVSTLNFAVLLVILSVFAFGPLRRMLEERRARIEQGLKDAEQARRDRENAESERVETLSEARKEANEILTRAQRVAQETRDADIAATKEELERMRERATGEIEAEKQRAIAELRGEVADLALAAASRVVGESMTDDRQRRLVQEFISSSSTNDTDSKD